MVGFGMGALGYALQKDKHPSYWFMSVAYGLLTVGMMRNLQEEAGLGDVFPNMFSVLGYVLAACAIVGTRPHTWGVLLPAAAFLWNGVVHALLWKKKLGPNIGRVVSMIGATALLCYYVLMSHALLLYGDAHLMFASAVILAVYYGITLGMNVSRHG